MRINVLTPGFTTSNGSAFLFPFVAHRNALRDASVDIRFVNRSTQGLSESDVLAIDSKEFRSDWKNHRSRTLDLITSYRRSGAKILWFDTTDSTGTLQAAAMQVVDKYLKSQLLIDTSRYTKRIYSGRVHSDFYHRTEKVEDDDGITVDEPISLEYASKLAVSWNSGLADYSTFGPFRMALYRKTRIARLLGYPAVLEPASSTRSIDISARFGVTYGKSTVRYQRERIREQLNDRLDTSKLNRREYVQELRQSKITLSPFGWGEITLKDFEVFLTGGMLIKPTMDHMQTWPNFFESGATYLSHNWDLSDLIEKIDWALTHESEREAIARQGQLRYIEHTSGPDAAEKFLTHLWGVLST